MLEARLHEFSCFVTLTYADENLPSGASLSPRDAQLFLKRLRKRLGSARPVRFYLVGEYGDLTQRPHYHLALFGVSELEHSLLLEAWGLGHVQVGTLTLESAQYIAGYVTKKMTAPGDPRLKGRYPEFARMSRRGGGIGLGAIPQIAEALNSRPGAAFISSTLDVPSSLTHGTKSYPLGRYLRRQLREEMGFDQVGGQEAVAARQAQELRALCAVEGTASVFSEAEKVRVQKVRQVEGRAAIHKKRGSI